MTRQLKVGDKLRLKRDSDLLELPQNSIVTVSKIIESENGLTRFHLKEDNTVQNWHLSWIFPDKDWFELVEEEKEEQKKAHEFKIGDKIDCINNKGRESCLDIGKTYTIDCIEKSISKKYPIFKLKEIKGENFFSCRFKPISYTTQEMRVDVDVKKECNPKSKYHVGQEVMWLNERCMSFTVGKTYKIEKIVQSDGHYLLNNNGDMVPFFNNDDDYFRTLTKEEKESQETIDLNTLERGDQVQFRNGDLHDVENIENNKYREWPFFLTFKDESVFNYTVQGMYGDFEHKWDIVKIIKKEESKIEKLQLKVGDKLRDKRGIVKNVKENSLITVSEIIFLLKDIICFKFKEDKHNLNWIYLDEIFFELVVEPRINFSCGCSFNKITHETILCAEHKGYGRPMQSSELRVGMVFKDGENYRKITNIGEMVSHLIKFPWDNAKGDCSRNLVEFCEQYKLIEKVPSKIVEVEEEVPVYISQKDYDYFVSKPHKLHVSFFDLKISFEKNDKELCKIKRKVKKEFNWDWGEAEWL